MVASSPVTVEDGQQFKLRGASNVEEQLNKLPQVNPSQTEFDLSGVTGTATVDLRGLGPVRTLVLVNGRRLMPGDPRLIAADINSVPVSLIQRVEVLTGGAAAVYGSDAVAGVVNFILDPKLDGLKVDADTGAYWHDNRDEFAQGLLDQRQLPYPHGQVFDGRRTSVSVAFGRSFLDGRANVAVYGGYRRIDGVTQDRRDYGACPVNAIIVDRRPSSTLRCGGSIVSYPGNFFDNLGNVYQVTADRMFVPGMTRFNFSHWNFYQRPNTRYTAGGFADLNLSDVVHPYAEVMAMKDRSVWQVGPSGNFTNTETINCDNPLLSAQQRSLICRTGNLVGEIPTLDDNGNVVSIAGSPTQFIDPVTGAAYRRAWLLIARRNIEAGPIQDDLRHRSIRLVGGVKGELARGVSYDASYLYGHVSLDRRYRNNISISRLGKAIDVVSDPSTGQSVCRSALIAEALGPAAGGADASCVPWDVFATGPVSGQSIAYLSIPPSMRGALTEKVANFNATIRLGQWGLGSPWSDEPSILNVGAERRQDSVHFDPDAFSEVGDVAGFGEQVYAIRGSIRTHELFVEAHIPLVSDRLVRRLLFEGGFRKSWYRGANSGFSTHSSKLALDLTAVDGLRFRASRQGAIRAPNVQELFAPVQPDAFRRDPCAGPFPAATLAQCAFTGLDPTQYGHVAPVNASLFGYTSIIGGNPDVGPETSVTRTVGVIIQPRFLRGLNATVDWWDIRLSGAISNIGAQAIVDNCVASGDAQFCRRIHRDPNGSLWLGNGYVDNRQANLGSLRVRGIDAGADYSVKLGRFGTAKIDVRGSYVQRWLIDNGGLAEPYDCAGLFGEPCGIQPRWKHTARVLWETASPLSLAFQWRHIAGVRLAALNPAFNLQDSVSPANIRLPAQDFFDATATFRLDERFELRIGANNLFDRKPPLVVNNTAAGGGPSSGNTYPAWFDPLGRYMFAGISVTLDR